MARTRPCEATVRAGRLAKATQFATAASVVFDLAEDARDVADAYVTLCVHAGIAAADAVCCARLGEHSLGDNHHEAVALLDKVDNQLAKHLRTLLELKTRAGYSHTRTSDESVRRAGRAMDALVFAAQRTST
ncbi:hypothetical protein [Cellulomonas sp. PhB150]|uniref:hypothetical protein n=1 Tax=Cellulomonas sp. PhB150 TaxID=2485188 RepID=UPI000F4AAC33|nr:hypothetical protein [Cellulomonas sp. PhB150]ROS23961.1 hypothetical protein EDF34_3024 [Cellulomonas sp. PhB150]